MKVSTAHVLIAALVTLSVPMRTSGAVDWDVVNTILEGVVFHPNDVERGVTFDLPGNGNTDCSGIDCQVVEKSGGGFNLLTCRVRSSYVKAVFEYSDVLERFELSWTDMDPDSMATVAMCLIQSFTHPDLTATLARPPPPNPINEMLANFRASPDDLPRGPQELADVDGLPCSTITCLLDSGNRGWAMACIVSPSGRAMMLRHNVADDSWKVGISNLLDEELPMMAACFRHRFDETPRIVSPGIFASVVRVFQNATQ